ncbi:phosphatase PAP2 family protein [Dietzia sp. ANT_WB102]|uniref:phosphatase PAP2 family protein n=1 Tax=Dietzia sp. ANT_WB102 TaxID=2597345 RepID=UPI0011EF961D|nr:phosphatase PAP2 family protein [Dietzia sp. ANT_WB102]KAA0919860.1 phosphatase PAP2 family protein [Dietzia sp. ANT_WB102]
MPDPVWSEPAAVEIPAPTGEVRLLSAVQRRLLAVPGSREAAVTLSHLGEHALGWMAIAAAGMAVDPGRRGRWAMVGVGTFGAHATSVVVKRVVRRRRPDHPAVTVGVGTPSTLSFPSSHATSTTAFALLAGSVSGVPVAPALVPVMLASRLVLGVHYPSDVLAGAAVGAGCAALTRVVWESDAVQDVLPATLRDGAASPRVTQNPEEKR